MRHEVGQRAQLAREDEVEERPEFLEVVLDGRAGHYYPVTGPELSTEGLIVKVC